MDSKAIGRQYDQIADHWQEPHLQSNGLAQFEKAIQFTKNRGSALDIGCGSSGRFIDLLSRHGFVPEGLDVSQKMIALAKERHPHNRFYEADITSIAVANALQNVDPSPTPSVVIAPNGTVRVTRVVPVPTTISPGTERAGQNKARHRFAPVS
jgi:SAM-dependent methyltransferase